MLINCYDCNLKQVGNMRDNGHTFDDDTVNLMPPA